jgi:tRNA dimethylallyltransferase
MPFLKPVLAIVGPTCTGKTELSIQLAKELSGEIVAADSRTIYKKMNIGTAKPTTEQQAQIKHYALDLLEPNRFFTVSEYVHAANRAIKSIQEKEKLPVICGGTGLYTRALLEGIKIPPVAPQEDLRTELNDFADKNGNEALHAWLNNLDSAAALRLNVNDRRRIVRALEVCLITGKPFSTLAEKIDPPYDTLWIGLKWTDNTKHKDLIARRLNNQLEQGLLDEVKSLWQELSYRKVLANAINYKEFIPYLEKSSSWIEARQQCIQDNYQLARKQMIWFNARHTINWLSVDELSVEQQLAKILELSLLRTAGKSYTK